MKNQALSAPILEGVCRPFCWFTADTLGTELPNMLELILAIGVATKILFIEKRMTSSRTAFKTNQYWTERERNLCRLRQQTEQRRVRLTFKNVINQLAL